MIPDRPPRKKRLDEAVGDPWRFKCIHCECLNQIVLLQKERSHKEDFAANGYGQQNANESRRKRVSCYRCGKRANEVYDKKQGTNVKVTELLD